MDLKHIAQTARLHLTNEEFETLTRECGDILELFSVLEGADVDGVEPAFRPIESGQTWREDEVEDSITQAHALHNVAESEEGYIVGPKTTQ